MARRKEVVPSYLLHKSTGQARVRINGRDMYLGPYGSEESRIRYGELIAKHAAGLPIDPVAGSHDVGAPPDADPGTVSAIVAYFVAGTKPA